MSSTPRAPEAAKRRARAVRGTPADPLAGPGPTQTPVPWAKDERVWEHAPGASAAFVLAHNAGGPRPSPEVQDCLARGETMTLEQYLRAEAARAEPQP